MKVTSQTRSATWVRPTFCPAKTWLKLILRVGRRFAVPSVSLFDSGGQYRYYLDTVHLFIKLAVTIRI
jgi:hypothetical protein